jgi:hypothetical protein
MPANTAQMLAPWSVPRVASGLPTAGRANSAALPGFTPHTYQPPRLNLNNPPDLMDETHHARSDENSTMTNPTHS